MKPIVGTGWKEILEQEFNKDYFHEISNFLDSEKNAGKEIYPSGQLIFNAFQLTSFKDVKVVILGQDPYHGPGQAMGLSFSVPSGLRIPASLKRIYAEIQRDVGITIPEHGDLTYWAEQGVFLLNSILTVEAKKPGSHRKIGWQEFTNTVIKSISDHKEGIVFLLWGNFAKSKKVFIDQEKHFIMESAHPSPLAGNAFQGGNHFSRTNKILRQLRKEEIDWQV